MAHAVQPISVQRKPARRIAAYNRKTTSTDGESKGSEGGHAINISQNNKDCGTEV